MRKENWEGKKINMNNENTREKKDTYLYIVLPLPEEGTNGLPVYADWFKNSFHQELP